jgi:hypothetical protein
MGVKKNLSGNRYGRWLVLSEAEPYKSPSGRYYIMWNCICDCGNMKVVRTTGLTSNSAGKSCGCLSAELTSERMTTHSMSKSRECTSYRAMKKRCYNPNDPSYKDYGGRGIKVCDRWLISFDNFYNDMGSRPLYMTLDRINNDKDYTPENCKWSTKKEQQLNRRPRGGSSQFRGVCWSKRWNCFVAQIWIGSIQKNKKIGNFKTEIEAAIAYDNFIVSNNLPNKTNNLKSSNST